MIPELPELSVRNVLIHLLTETLLLMEVNKKITIAQATDILLSALDEHGYKIVDKAEAEVAWMWKPR